MPATRALISKGLARSGCRLRFRRLGSGSFRRELHAQRAEHAQDGSELRFGVAVQRLVEARPGQTGVAGDPGHPLCAGHGADGSGDHGGVAVFERGVEEGDDRLLVGQALGGLPADGLGGYVALLDGFRP